MTENPFPDSSLVKVKYPAAGQEQAPRDTWPWTDGWVERRVGPDEWQVIVTDPDADEIGPDGEDESPWCYRNRTEIRLARCRSLTSVEGGES